MKRKRFARTAALLLLLAVLFSAVPAGAGGVDLSQMSSDEIAALLKGTPCRGVSSCPDQLARAIETYPD